MDESIREAIDKRLIELNLPPFHELDENIQHYLVKIEIAIQKIEVERADMLKQYKMKKISVVSVSKEAKIARATVYNHKGILERYIQSNQEIQERDDVYCKQELLTDKIKELENEIYLLQQRDVNFELLKYENAELINKIQEDTKEIEALEKHRKMLIDKIELLEKKVLKNTNNIVALRDKQ